MRSRPAPSIALVGLGLVTWTLVGCQEAPQVDAPTASNADATAPAAMTTATTPTHATATATDASSEAAALPPAVEPATATPAADANLSAPPLAPVVDAVEAGTRQVEGALDKGVRKTAQEVSGAIENVVPAPLPAPPAVPPPPADPSAAAAIDPGAIAAPVVNAAQQKVSQTAAEVNQEIERKADGLKQEFRQATDAFDQKAREASQKATSGLMKTLKSKAKETAKEVAPPKAP